MKITKIGNRLTARKKILLLILVLLFSAIFLYYGESDKGRLARAYWLQNPLFCNFIYKEDIRTRCTAVLTADFDLCNNIKDDHFYPFCLYGVSIRKADPAACEEAADLMTEKCLKSFSLIQKEYETRQNYVYNVTRQREMCYGTGSVIQGHCLSHYAVRYQNLFSCDRIRDGRLKDYCIQSITRNASFFCTSPEFCLALKGCDEWGDMCYGIRAGITQDRDLCNMIIDKNRRDGCYISLTDEIFEFTSCCDMF